MMATLAFCCLRTTRFISFTAIHTLREVSLYVSEGKRTIAKLSFPDFIRKEWLESLMENISGKNVSSRRLQVSSFELPKRLTEDVYATKQARVKSYNQTSKHFLAMSESHSIRKSCLLISGTLNRF